MKNADESRDHYRLRIAGHLDVLAGQRSSAARVQARPERRREPPPGGMTTLSQSRCLNAGFSSFPKQFDCVDTGPSESATFGLSVRISLKNGVPRCCTH
jgi:hypothetical protein